MQQRIFGAKDEFEGQLILSIWLLAILKIKNYSCAFFPSYTSFYQHGLRTKEPKNHSQKMKSKVEWAVKYAFCERLSGIFHTSSEIYYSYNIYAFDYYS